MDPNTQRAESDRWLGIAAKLLTARDFLGSRTFAIRARESDPNNSVSDQILAVVDTLLSGEKRVQTNQQPDWYSVLQLPPLVRDPDLISSHYRRLALLLSPDRNRLPFADYALQLVMDAWSVLSDPTKKWLFDNELALSLHRANSEPQLQPHRVEPVRVDPIRVDPATVAAMAAASTASVQLNTFEFFQPQPPPQPQPQPTLQMWQQQPQPPPPQQLIQREFMPPPQPQPPPQPPQPQLPPQWQMRDPNKSPASRPPGVVAATSAPPRAGPVAVSVPNPTSTPAPAPTEKPMEGNRVVVEEGNAGTDSAHGNCDNVGNENNEMVESFWTACPYCFYIYEYQKEYQECTLRCQNCRRGFHALPVPNPPPIGPDNGGRGKGNKEEEESFCCWGFFPLGFSMPAWKKQNRNGSGNWVPFSPMFASPVGGNFHWFANNGTSVGLKNNNVGGRGGLWNGASAPRVYIDDEEDLLDVSDSSGGDSSDRDWRNPGTNKKRKKHRKGKFGGGKRGRPRKVDKMISQGNQDSAGGVGVSVGRDDVEDGFEGQEVVVGLVAGVKTDANKNVGSTVMRKQTRRSMKDMGRLDLNVEFNNEGDDHAPTVSAVNGEEDGIENIGFFEGLDEFLSTLPILKPS